ncbi:MAG: hypothetical protein ACRECV_10330 [Xanthobacteraceae bacterium]
MRILIAVEAAGWTDSGSTARERQAHRSAVSKVVRDMAERIQIGASDGEFERVGIVGSFKVEDDAAADAA